jgi:hypothetical protein
VACAHGRAAEEGGGGGCGVSPPVFFLEGYEEWVAVLSQSRRCGLCFDGGGGHTAAPTGNIGARNLTQRRGSSTGRWWVVDARQGARSSHLVVVTRVDERRPGAWRKLLFLLDVRKGRLLLLRSSGRWGRVAGGIVVLRDSVACCRHGCVACGRAGQLGDDALVEVRPMK